MTDDLTRGAATGAGCGIGLMGIIIIATVVPLLAMAVICGGMFIGCGVAVNQAGKNIIDTNRQKPTQPEKTQPSD